MKQLTLASFFSNDEIAAAAIHSLDNITLTDYSPSVKEFESSQYYIKLELVGASSSFDTVDKRFATYQTVSEGLKPIYHDKIERLFSDGILDGYPIRAYSRFQSFGIFVDMYRHDRRLIVTATFKKGVK